MSPDFAAACLLFLGLALAMVLVDALICASGDVGAAIKAVSDVGNDLADKILGPPCTAGPRSDDSYAPPPPPPKPVAGRYEEAHGPFPRPRSATFLRPKSCPHCGREA